MLVSLRHVCINVSRCVFQLPPLTKHVRQQQCRSLDNWANCYQRFSSDSWMSLCVCSCVFYRTDSAMALSCKRPSEGAQEHNATNRTNCSFSLRSRCLGSNESTYEDRFHHRLQHSCILKADKTLHTEAQTATTPQTKQTTVDVYGWKR